MKALAYILLLISASGYAGIGGSDETRYILPSGWTEFLALSTGIMDAENRGIPNSVKIIGSKTLAESKWVADAGIGWQFHILNSGEEDVINSGIVELGIRYQLSNKWELGGIVNTLVTDKDYYGATDKYVTFAGPAFMKNYKFQEADMRFGVSILRDMNIDSENADSFIAHLHVRFGGERAH
jgi:hypothetical protein